MIVDDSFVMRAIVGEIVKTDPGLEIIGEAEDGQEALEKVRTAKPDVILLDIEMPRMDGVEFMKRLRLVSRSKVIVISSVIQLGSPQAAEIWKLGVSEVIEKPSGALSLDLQEIKGAEIVKAIKRAVGKA